MDEAGALEQAPDMDRMRRNPYALGIQDTEPRETISETWEPLGLQ
jgi:hypothetical protein